MSSSAPIIGGLGKEMDMWRMLVILGLRIHKDWGWGRLIEDSGGEGIFRIWFRRIYQDFPQNEV
jgi:hypothetical protein